MIGKTLFDVFSSRRVSRKGHDKWLAIALCLLLLIGVFTASGQAPGKDKPILHSQFSLSISTYNHAERIIKGTAVYELKGNRLTVSRRYRMSKKANTIESIKIGNDILERIESMKLDTLNGFYNNNCVMATSGSEYFISITKGKSTRNIRLHHYYIQQIEKLAGIINELVSHESKLDYVPPDTKQDCK